MKRITALLLVIITALSVSSLVSCAKTETELPDIYESESRNYETEQVNEIESDTETETETESETETHANFVRGGFGGSVFRCKHTGENNWNQEYHDIRNGLITYVGDSVWDWSKQEPQAYGCGSGFDGIGEGSWYNLYDYVHIFNIPRDIFELSFLYDYPGYYSVLTSEQVDMIYEDRAEDFENFFLNLGPVGTETTDRVNRLFFEEELLFELIIYRYGSEGKYREGYTSVTDYVNSRFSDEYYRGILPSYTAVYSIPEIIYINDITREEFEEVFEHVIYYCGEGCPHFDYDIDLILGEREKYEKLIADARALEDPLDMLKATRAINEMIRK